MRNVCGSHNFFGATRIIICILEKHKEYRIIRATENYSICVCLLVNKMQGNKCIYKKKIDNICIFDNGISN